MALQGINFAVFRSLGTHCQSVLSLAGQNSPNAGLVLFWPFFSEVDAKRSGSSAADLGKKDRGKIFARKRPFKQCIERQKIWTMGKPKVVMYTFGVDLLLFQARQRRIISGRKTGQEPFPFKMQISTPLGFTFLHTPFPSHSQRPRFDGETLKLQKVREPPRS